MNFNGAHCVTLYLEGQPIASVSMSAFEDERRQVRKFEQMLHTALVLHPELADKPHYIEIEFSDGTFQRFGTDKDAMVLPIAITPPLAGWN